MLLDIFICPAVSSIKFFNTYNIWIDLNACEQRGWAKILDNKGIRVLLERLLALLNGLEPVIENVTSIAISL
jgi:hypothetical protein